MWKKWLRLWYWKRSTKIKLWSTETIGVDGPNGGYFGCKRWQLRAGARLHKSGDVKAFNEEMAICERVYFGPKWVKA